MNHDAGRLPQIGALFAIASLILALGVPLTAAGKTEKVTICHAAGQEGTDQYVTLELSYQAVYGNAGHLNEDGTSQAGHEGDHVGPCIVETTTTTITETGVTVADTTTTVPDSTTTTVGSETSSTTADSTTTTTVAEKPATDPTTTTSTVPAVVDAVSETTTTTGSDEPQEDVGDTATSTSETSSAPEASTTAGASPVTGTRDTSAGSADTLPYTGIEESLLVPASLMLMAGAFLIFATAESAGVHASTVNPRFGLGLYRGRHESATRN